MMYLQLDGAHKAVDAVLLGRRLEQVPLTLAGLRNPTDQLSGLQGQGDHPTLHSEQPDMLVGENVL